MAKISRKLFITWMATLIISAGLFWAGQSFVKADSLIRSIDFFVGSSESQVSTAIDYPFSIYIGDNLAGITDPNKSVYFVVTGVYTGAGSLQLQIDSDSATTKTFSLPNVSAPTNFNIVYHDEINKINPASAGTFSYTLNLTPSGVTISGLGALLEITYQFVDDGCPDGASSNEKIKTTDFFVGSSAGQLNTATSLPFSIYIGDNIADVINPIKSLYFTISGLYSGSGSLQFKINSDNATAQSFSLPNVSAPTNFNFIYEDSTGKISPTSPGNYDYNLNIIPSGVDLFVLGSKLTMSHRYQPPACGLGYPAYGDLISSTFDSTVTSAGAAFNSVMWKGFLGGSSQDQGQVKIQIAASDNSSGPWSYLGSSCIGGNDDWYTMAPNTATPLGCYSQFNNKRYFRYKIRICSDDCTTGGTFTPQVDSVVVNWSP